MHIWDVWNTRRLHRLPRLRPAVRVRVRLPGPAGLVDADPRRPRRARCGPTPPGCCCTRRPRTATPSSPAGCSRTSRVPADMDDWHWAMSLQPGPGRRASASSTSAPGHHAAAARSSGSSTTAGRSTSWAAVDGDGRRKPLWYALRRAYADRLLTVQPRGRRPWPSSRSTTPTSRGPARGRTRTDLDGAVLAKGSLTLEAAPRSTATLALPDRADHRWERHRRGPRRRRRRAARAVVLRRGQGPGPDLGPGVAGRADDRRLRRHVTARTLQRDVTLLADKVDPAAVVDDAMITLLAGESATFHVRSEVEVDPEVFLRRSVLRRRTTWSTSDRRSRRSIHPAGKPSRLPCTTPTTEETAMTWPRIRPPALAGGRDRPAAGVRPRLPSPRRRVRLAGHERPPAVRAAGRALGDLPDDPRLRPRTADRPAGLRPAGRPRRAGAAGTAAGPGPRRLVLRRGR